MDAEKKKTLQNKLQKSKSPQEFISTIGMIKNFNHQFSSNNKRNKGLEILKKIEILCIQEKYDEALDLFPFFENHCDQLSTENIENIKIIWEKIQSVRDENSTPPQKNNTAKDLLNKMRLFFAAGHYEKAITVSETIQELYYNRLDEKDIEECLLIFDELKIIQQSCSENNIVPENTGQISSANKQQKITEQSYLLLASWILAYSFHQDPNSILPEVRDLINFFLDQEKKQWSKFNVNMVANIATIIFNKHFTIFEPYEKIIKEQE